MRDPRAPLAVAAGLLALSLATSQPLVVLAALIGAVLLYLAAPGPHALMLRVAVASGLLLLALNPFVAVEGDRVLIAGPTLGLLDLEVTAEELLYGLISGARLATAIIAVAAFLALADPDRLQALVGRVAPRSTLTVALAARLVPALRRDAVAMREALALRGDPAPSGRRAQLRRSSGLVEPLLASSLDRGVGIAEAMAARGYGAAAFTRLPEAPPSRGERGALALGVALLALAAAAVAGALPYAVYPVADPIGTPRAVLAALGVIVASAAAARALRGPR